MRPTRSGPFTEQAGGDESLPHPRLIILAVLLAVQICAIVAIPMPPLRQIAALMAANALGLLQLLLLRGTAPCPRRPTTPWQRRGILAVEALATFLPPLTVGAVWPGMGGLLAASILLVLRGRLAWALFAAVTLSVFGAVLAVGSDIRGAVNITVAGVAIGLTMFAVCRLHTRVTEERFTHAEATQVAVAGERLRFARDLHDLLGYSLAAITLRAELTRRLIGTDPATASTELQDVVDIARQAVAEVRQVVDGYRDVSLAQEMAAAASLLSSAGIDTQVDMNCAILPVTIDGALAMVLRELITNVLRHSSARHCWITAEEEDDRVTLVVVNDGVSPAASVHRDGGGLENLVARLEPVGGMLSAAISGEGRFHVAVEIAVKSDAVAGARGQGSGCAPP